MTANHLPKPLTEVIYRVDMVNQYRNMSAARAEHICHVTSERALCEEQQHKAQRVPPGPPSAPPAPALPPPPPPPAPVISHALQARWKMMMDHFRAVASAQKMVRIYSLCPH